MNDSKKEKDAPTPPFKKLQQAKALEKEEGLKRELEQEMSRVPAACKNKIKQLGGQISGVQIKINALKKNKNPEMALREARKKKALPWKLEKELMRSKSVVEHN